MNLKNVGEFGLISIIKDKFQNIKHTGVEGIGDDCAILPLSDKEAIVITTDMLIEGKHFLRDNISPYELGYKTLAVNLSDVAAMGATPYVSLLSIAISSDVDTLWAEEFIRGYKTLSEKYNVALIGGDTTAANSGAICLSVTALGRVASKNIKRRSAAQATDWLVVNKPLGDSALALNLMLNEHECPAALRQAHNTPQPMVNEGLFLSQRAEVGAMMDVSDGISSDVKHICTQSHCGAKIYTHKLPTTDLFNSTCATLNLNTLDFSLAGGEDYALLMSVRRADFEQLAYDYQQATGGTLHIIGEITEEEELLFYDENGKEIDVNIGFRHF